MFGSAVHFQMKWERQEKNKPETKKKNKWEHNFLPPGVMVSSQFSTLPQNTSFLLYVVSTSLIPTTPFEHHKPSQFINTDSLPLLQAVWRTPV